MSDPFRYPTELEWASDSMICSRRSIAILVVLATPITFLAVREAVDGHRRRVARDAVVSLGGKAGSLPSLIPLLGSELRYEFHGTNFSDGDLQRLLPLAKLSGRHWVGIMFKDTNITSDNIAELKVMLPGCHPFRIVDGERMLDP